MNKQNQKNGFALFISLVIMGIILTASVAIVDIAVKELSLSSGDRESQHAFYAADSGLECALYGDLKLGIFNPGNTENLFCNGNEVAIEEIGGVYTFNITLKNTIPSQDTCANVTVIKEGEPTFKTYIESSGYNKCSPHARRVERTIQFDY